jgi:hypothetical protein
MPPRAPVPKLLGTLDEEGWVILVFEEIVDGRNPDPDWDPGELRRAVAALAEMADALTPPPIDAPSVEERLTRGFRGWNWLREAHAEGRDDLAWLDPWARNHLDDLIRLETASASLSRGNTLVNLDVRADNILMTADRVYIVDWPWASVGAAWLDLALLVPSVWMHGGRDRAHVVTGHPLLADAGREAVTAFVAGLTGMLLERSRQPAPQSIPTLRTFQRAYGTAALEWLRTLMAR